MENQPKYRILIATDFSDLAGEAFMEALSLARRNPYAELHVAAVVDKGSQRIVPVEDRRTSMVQITDHLRERLIAETERMLGPDPTRRVPTTVHIRVGKIAEQIAGLAGEIGADLVVVGTHGRRGVRHLLLGSVAERTVRLAPCAVLVVRPRTRTCSTTCRPSSRPAPPASKTREETRASSGGAKPIAPSGATSTPSRTAEGSTTRTSPPPTTRPKPAPRPTDRSGESLWRWPGDLPTADSGPASAASRSAHRAAAPRSTHQSPAPPPDRAAPTRSKAEPDARQARPATQARAACARSDTG